MHFTESHLYWHIRFDFVHVTVSHLAVHPDFLVLSSCKLVIKMYLAHYCRWVTTECEIIHGICIEDTLSVGEPDTLILILGSALDAYPLHGVKGPAAAFASGAMEAD